MGDNWIELSLSKDEEELVRRGAALYKTVHLDTIDNIFVIARSIKILHDRHHGSGTQGSFGEALVQYGFTARDGSPMNKAVRSHLKTLLDNEQSVRAWWETVRTTRQARDWLSASAIHKHWKASQRPPPPPRGPSPYVAMKPTNAAPDQAALVRELEQAKARIAELEQELISGRERHEAAPAGGLARARGSFRQPLNENTKLQVENAELRARIKRLTPTLDGEVIKLRKENEELRGERTTLKRVLRQTVKERDRNAVVRSSPLLRAAAAGSLKRANYRKIVACLHRDTRRSKSETQIDEASALFIELQGLFQFND